jgi:putative heme-binding domain-containing protein
MQTAARSPKLVWSSSSSALGSTRRYLHRAAQIAADEKRSIPERSQAIHLLAFAPPESATKTLPALLSPQEPQELQLAAVRALSQQDPPGLADTLLERWSAYSPGVRREVIEVLFSRTERLSRLLDVLEAKKVTPSQLEPGRLVQLRRHPNAELRRRADRALAGHIAPQRDQVVQAYRTALSLKGEVSRGKLVFQKTCSTCHRLENMGHEVGADLQSALRNKTPEALLVDILDPSREVDSRYLEYVVTTGSGKVMTGLIAAETSSSVTLRRAEGAEDTILRTQIESIQGTAKSLMPDGLEMQMDRQSFADLIAYLQAIGKR